MGFIIGLCGFFLGVAFIAILAVIGYFAERNDSKNNVKSENVVNNDNVINDDIPVETGFMSFDELPNVDKKLNDVISDFSDSNISKNTNSDSVLDSDINNGSTQNVIPEKYTSDIPDVSSLGVDINNNSVISTDTVSLDNGEVSNNTQEGVNDSSRLFSSSDFENIDMSLDDLEKKNYNDMVSENKNIEDDNYYYSNLDNDSSNIENFAAIDDYDKGVVSDAPVNFDNSEVSGAQDISSNIDKNLDEKADNVSDNSDVINDTDNNLSDGDTKIDDLSSFENKNENIVSGDTIITDNSELIEQNPSSDNNVDLNNGQSNIVPDDSNDIGNYMFDSEVSTNDDTSDSIPEIVSSEDVADSSIIHDENQNSEIPEISDDNYSIFDNDSSDDDIWKF